MLMPRPLVLAVLCALAEMRYGPAERWNVFYHPRNGLEVRP